ncbi:MAG: hypothetical protein M3Q75_02790, partial [Gemmatimonadota bacterium]|nr:hypothetical protein [Gemmatimonadota bacterium]
MAITRPDAAQTVTAAVGTTSLSFTKPTGLADGDVLVMAVGQNGGSTPTAPSGWTLFWSGVTQANPKGYAYYKVITGAAGEPSTYDWTLSAAITHSAGLIRLVGVDTTTPLDVESSPGTNTVAPYTVPGITTVTAGAYLLGAITLNSSNVANTTDSPAGWVELWELGGKRSSADEIVQAAAGATGDLTWTTTGSTTTPWTAVLAAFRPAIAGGGGGTGGVFLSDTFTDVEGTLLSAHTGETGATWTQHPTQTATAEIAANRARSSATTNAVALYYASGMPATADYDVEAVGYVASSVNECSVAGRMDTTVYTLYEFGMFSSSYVLSKITNGSRSILGSVSNTFTAGESVTIKLEMRGNQISGYANGVLVIGPITDATITASGRAGLRFSGASSDTTSFHLNSITATDYLVQYARPASDVTDGTWTDQAGGTNLFAAIDEITASFTDYIESAELTTTASVCEV